MYRASSLLVCAALFTGACAAPGKQVAADDAPLDEAPSDDAASRATALKDALASVATARSPFYLDALRTVVRGNTVSFDFSGVDIDPASRALLTQLLQFSMPPAFAGHRDASLDDPNFASAFGKMLLADESKLRGFENDDFSSMYASAESIVSACEKAGFPASFDFMGANFDCTFFVKQPTSGRTITTFEATAILAYTSAEFHTMNALLRGEHVPELNDDRVKAIDVVLTLATMSGLNKHEKMHTTTYRGGPLEPSCEPNAPALAPPPNSTQEAITRFCEYSATAQTERDCGFVSTSNAPDVALGFSNPEPGAPKSLEVVYEIDGHSGVDVSRMSANPQEHEVLYPPDVPFDVVPGSAAIALVPAHPMNTPLTYADYEIVPCGAPLTDEQAARVSHFRVHLREP